MRIRAYRSDDETQVIALWRECDLTRPWNDPHRDIARKLAEDPEFFLVGTIDDRVVATAMIGYDGHRGTVFYLAVSPAHQRLALGRTLMTEAERRLTVRGCPKLNVQIRSSNLGVIEFYRRLGYTQDAVVNFGKRLIPDE